MINDAAADTANIFAAEIGEMDAPKIFEEIVKTSSAGITRSEPEESTACASSGPIEYSPKKAEPVAAYIRAARTEAKIIKTEIGMEI